MNEDEIQIEPIVEKPSKAERILRSEAARQRRREVKESKSIHSYKEEKEARGRLVAKRRMAKLKRQKVNRIQNTA